MKRLENGKAIAIIVLFMSVSALNGQTTATSAQKAITKKDFEEVDKKAKQWLKTGSYRLTRTTESPVKNGKEPSEITKRMEEYVPPDRNRLLFEVSGRPESLKTEWITIGKVHFKKDNDGTWIKSPKERRPEPLPFSLLKREYFSDAPILVDGKKVNVLVVTERTKTEVIRGPLTIVEIEQDRVKFKTSEIICDDKQTHWYDSGGRRMKISGEVHCTEKGKPDDNRHYVEVYEYDLNIKIEAPIK